MLLANFYFIFTLLIAKISAENYFCDFSCGKDHTVCTRPNCEPGSKCGSNYQILPFTDDDRSAILALHNERRNYVASGQETRFGNGRASNMRALSYSKEIEYVAQCWANSCDLSSDICGATKKFPGDVGQNRKWLNPSADSDLKSTSFLNDSMSSWYDYINLSNSTILDLLPANAGTIYTQLMWAKTTHIGCGRVAFGDSPNDTTLYIVCNYGLPHGTNEPVYLRGEPCSDCSKCNDKYTSLCGDVEDFTKETYTPPNNNTYTSAEISVGTFNRIQKIPEILETIVPNTPVDDSANNISEINIKLLNLVEYTRQQEKQLTEFSQQIKSNNQQIDELKTIVESVVKNNENYVNLLKRQKELLEMFTSNEKS